MLPIGGLDWFGGKESNFPNWFQKALGSNPEPPFLLQISKCGSISRGVST